MGTFDRLKGLEVNMLKNAKQRRIFPDAFKWETVAAIRGGRTASQVTTGALSCEMVLSEGGFSLRSLTRSRDDGGVMGN